MKKWKNQVKLLLLAGWLLVSLLQAVTIYEIQYTSNPGNGSYPSDLAGQYVTTQGIVTAYGYSGYYGYYISMPEGGAWKGVLVYDDDHSPVPGSLVEVTGQVWEYYGLTEIRNVTSYTLLSAGNTIPPAAVITTTQVNDEEYEGVLMRVQNAVVTEGINTYGEWKVSDGSGNCTINDVFFDQTQLGTLTTPGVLFDSITGIGHYGYGIYSLNPRSAADVLINVQGVVITLPSLQAPVNSTLTVPINVSNLTQAQGFNSYAFNLSFDPNILSYTGYTSAGTLSSSGTVNVNSQLGSLSVSFNTSGILQGQGTLLKLNFNTMNNGVSPLSASNFTFNSTPVMLINQGLATIGSSGGEVIDTLSVIQRPLLNIPAIVIPGESLQIECVAPPTTSGWAAWLYKGNLNHSLTITNTQYEAVPGRWVLTAQVPNVNVFELYSLRVTASGGISDRTRNSVQVLPTRKTSYYFAQVTDVHMPTHIFYPDYGYDTDSTETVDFREVINDLNLIRPEFVLLTGDLVNQGELEEFENLRVYSKGKRLLGEFEVPVYMIAGNHDIGGWPSTSPPAGSARKFWWKNFGWSWLNNSSTSFPYHTQDYSFDYGPVHYVGLEGYDNYDNYLPAIYGSNSYTPAQMQWLQNDLTAAGAETNVLFHHYDFDDELNLSALGIDMSLWGHIHYNSGSLTSTPYNLATDNVCDGNRSYRIIRVNGTSLQPFATLTAGSSGNQVRISYTPNNYGVADSVSASVINTNFLGFENALVKFRMPSGNTEYTVTGGVLEQVDRSGENNICYVRFNLPANSTVTVTIKAHTTAVQDETAAASVLRVNAVYPNPFTQSAAFSLNLDKASDLSINVYNLKGERVRQLHTGRSASGNLYFTWDSTADTGKTCSPGIYLVRFSGSFPTQTRKLIRLN
jgi:hypothetical protein